MSGNLKLNTALGGSVALTPENTASNITVTVPATAGTMATSESTLAQFNASGSAPVYACRAWVNFNGTGTVAIRASGNVSSITDNGTGDYRVNFTTAMSDTDYAVITGFQTPAWPAVTHAFSYLTTSVAVQCALGATPTFFDAGIFTVSIFR
jgi:hypothetical protein